MSPDKADLLEAAHAIAAEITADRRLIHTYPELAFNEHKTAALVAGRLREIGIEVTEGIGGTGVVGLLRGSRPGRTVLLRADMDALPIQEKNDVPFASQNPGAMHACGHDGHTAMLLAAARLLAERKDAIAGAVKFMFQPAEEGGFGAVKMIEDGLLEDPRVDGAFALHVNAIRYAGQVAMRVGPTMAAADRFEIEIKGRGGHAARPDMTVDPIVVAAHLITVLQTIISREVASNEQAVVTVGNLEAGSTYNAIPDIARMKGTFRSYSEDVRAQIRRRLPEIASGIASTMRATATTKLIPGYPVLVNHEAQVALVRATATRILGGEAVFESEPASGAEDFSYVLQRVPGAMFVLGVRNPAWAQPRPNHGPDFDMDESALPVGAAMLAATAIDFLGSG